MLIYRGNEYVNPDDAIESLSKEILMTYPSISPEDSVRFAKNMITGMKEVQQYLIADVYSQIFYEYLFNMRN